MAQITVSGLTFCYAGSFDNIFENVSFQIDTDWKLGFTGRNGKGKTTFLQLLLGKYEYQGTISSTASFDYFPFQVTNEWMSKNTIEVIEQFHPEYELWKICRELDLLLTSADILYRPYETLSHGERAKVMLAVLFSKENYFLLIDEPTNHLDMPTRKLLVEYLNQKKGYILVSHDRWLLNECVDHILILNRNTIEVEKGNFSTWWENKRRKDAYEMAENEKLKREINQLEISAKRSAAWADKAERSKIGFDPSKEHERCIDTRAYIGEKSKRMQQRRKNLERRRQESIEEKEKLLSDIEVMAELKLMQLVHHKELYLNCKEFSCFYDAKRTVVDNFNMELKRGDRIVIQGKNGTGKSTIIKSILAAKGVTVLNETTNNAADTKCCKRGILEAASGLFISYINQDTSFLTGKLDRYIDKLGISNSLFKAMLRQLDFERVQFIKNMEEYSEGQKKKVLIAGSLLQQAHLYIWDEPLNYIDIFSRMQIEQLVLKFKPTMLIVEHDKSFCSKVATQIIEL